jgi:hypothetical protein
MSSSGQTARLAHSSSGHVGSHAPPTQIALCLALRYLRYAAACYRPARLPVSSRVLDCLLARLGSSALLAPAWCVRGRKGTCLSSRFRGSKIFLIRRYIPRIVPIEVELCPSCLHSRHYNKKDRPILSCFILKTKYYISRAHLASTVSTTIPNTVESKADANNVKDAYYSTRLRKKILSSCILV